MTNPGFICVLAILLICSTIVIEGKPLKAAGHRRSKHPGPKHHRNKPNRKNTAYVDIIEQWCTVVLTSSLSPDNTLAEDLPELVTISCASPPRQVDKQEVIDMDLRIKEDLANNPDYETEVYLQWFNHPDMERFCCQRYSFPFIAGNVGTLLIPNDPQIPQGLIPVITSTNLRNEVYRICQTGNPDPIFCPQVFYYAPIADLIASLPNLDDKWATENEMGWDMAYFRGTVLVEEQVFAYDQVEYFVQYFYTYTRDIEESYVNIVDQLIYHIQNGDVQELKQMETDLGAQLVHGVSLCEAGDTVCLFMNTIEQFRIYMQQIHFYENSVANNETKKILIDVGTDYREFLQQKQLDRILEVLQEQGITAEIIAEDLAEQLESGFDELSGYYQEVAIFNAQIAEADMVYIKGRLDSFEVTAGQITGEFVDRLSTLLDVLLVGAGADVALDLIVLATEIAECFNPLEILFSGTCQDEVVDAINELLEAVQTLVELVTVFIALEDWSNKAIEMHDKLQLNEEFLLTVERLILEEHDTQEEFDEDKQKFIEMYNAYTPQVSKDDIIQVTAKGDILASVSCDALDDMNIPLDPTVCLELPVLVARMGEVYQDIYDFQFELMDSMAEYMRAMTNYYAAEMVNAEYEAIIEETDPSMDQLTIISGLTFMGFEAHMLQAVNHYCSFLKYSEGDVLPGVCDGPNTDIALLISKNPAQCTSHTLRYYEVPSIPAFPGDKAFVNITQLFQGTPVPFQIPDSQWLIDNHWINSIEQDQAFYVEHIDAYLPTTPNQPTPLYVVTDPVVQNHIFPGGPEYMLAPHTTLVGEHIVGPSRTSCPTTKVSNPYTSCEEDMDDIICPLTVSTVRVLYPSLYAKWNVQVIGGEALAPPNPATHLKLIFGVKLCKMTPPSFSAPPGGLSDDGCCPEGEYRPDSLSDCTACPSDSHSALSGYYCEHDPVSAK